MEFAEKYLGLMYCVLMADGIVHEKETKLFIDMMDNSGIAPELRQKYENMLDINATVPDFDALLSTIAEGTNCEQLVAMVKDAYIMSSIDEVVVESELEMIKKFLKLANIPESRHEEIQAWGFEGIDHLKKGKVLLSL